MMLPFVVQLLTGDELRGSLTLLGPDLGVLSRHQVYRQGRIGEPDSVLLPDLSVQVADGQSPVSIDVVYEDEQRDLALVRLATELLCALPRRLSNVDRRFYDQADWIICGYPQRYGGEQKVTSRSDVTLCTQDSPGGTLDDVQIEGGVEEGYSGAPVVSKHGRRWYVSAICVLGGRRAATSRFVTLESFLEKAREAAKDKDPDTKKRLDRLTPPTKASRLLSTKRQLVLPLCIVASVAMVVIVFHLLDASFLMGVASSRLKTEDSDHPAIRVLERERFSRFLELGDDRRVRETLNIEPSNSPMHPGIHKDFLLLVLIRIQALMCGRDYREAIYWCELLRKEEVPEHVPTASRYGGIISLMHGRTSDARRYFNDVIKGVKSNISSDPGLIVKANTAACHAGIAASWLLDRNFQAALNECELALNLVDKSRRERHPIEFFRLLDMVEAVTMICRGDARFGLNQDGESNCAKDSENDFRKAIALLTPDKQGGSPATTEYKALAHYKLGGVLSLSNDVDVKSQGAMHLGIAANVIFQREQQSPLFVAEICRRAGRAYFELGRYRNALRHFERAESAIRPLLREDLSGQSHIAMADILAREGDVHLKLEEWKRAIKTCRVALEYLDYATRHLNAEKRLLARAKINLGFALNRVGKSDEALSLLEQLKRELLEEQSNGEFSDELVRIDKNVAWIYASSRDPSVRDGKKALELANSTSQADDPDGSHLDTRAAAHAAIGEFTEAIRLQRLAIVKSPSNEDFRRRLELYLSSEPYFEEGCRAHQKQLWNVLGVAVFVACVLVRVGRWKSPG